MRFHQCTRRTYKSNTSLNLFCERPESTLPYLVIAPILPPHQLPIASCHRDMKFDSTLKIARVPTISYQYIYACSLR